MNHGKPEIPEAAPPVERELRYAIAAYRAKKDKAVLDAEQESARRARELFDEILGMKDEYAVVLRIAEDARDAGLPLPGIMFLYELAGSYPLDVGRILFARMNGTLRIVMPFGPGGGTRVIAGKDEVLYSKFDNSPAEPEHAAMVLFLKQWPQFKKKFLSAVRKSCQEN